MLRVSSACLCLVLLATPCVAQNEHGSLPDLAQLFQYARTHEVTKLEALRDGITASDNSTLKHAYFLALYMADAQRYRDEYVEHFPTDYEGIMFDYYERVELAHFTPEILYSFDILGRIAKEGHEGAIRKLGNAVTHSDGAVAELLCEYVTDLLHAAPEKLLRGLSTLEPESRRYKVYSCFCPLTRQRYIGLKKKLKRAAKGDVALEQVMKEIGSYSLEKAFPPTEKTP